MDESPTPEPHLPEDEWRGRRVFYDPNPGGNNGDLLIEAGDRVSLRHAGALLVNSPSDAEIICTRGGGFLRFYHGGGGIEEKIRGYLGDHRAARVVIFPASYSVESDLPSVFGDDAGRVTVYARERITHELLVPQSESSGFGLRLAHDHAFRLDDPVWRDANVPPLAERRLLIVERRDVETITGQSHPSVAVPLGVKRLVPGWIKNSVKRAVLTPRVVKAAAESPFAAKAERLFAETFPDAAAPAGEPPLVGDISLPGYFTFPFFVEAIATSYGVVTTRLHVGILAALLGKPTVIVSGSYHKIRGIHAMSLADKPHVRLVAAEALTGGAA